MVFGLYEEPVAPGQCNMVVERLGDYLVDQGMWFMFLLFIHSTYVFIVLNTRIKMVLFTVMIYASLLYDRLCVSFWRTHKLNNLLLKYVQKLGVM